MTEWVNKAVSVNVSEYTVPWVASESKFGYELAIEWIDAEQEFIAACGWSTLSSLVAIKSDDELDIVALKKLLRRVEQHIHTAGNRVRLTMNGFLIAVGSYVVSLTDDAINTSTTIGQVKVTMNGTACKIPDAVQYISKVKAKGKWGKKKKMARC